MWARRFHLNSKLALKIAASIAISYAVVSTVYIIGHQDAFAFPASDAHNAALSVVQSTIDPWKTVYMSPLQRNAWPTPTPTSAAQALLLPPLTFRIIRFADNLIFSPSTVVTGYFTTDSKFSSEKYIAWMANMLSTLDPMVVFTEATLVTTIHKYRRHALNATIIVQMSLQDLPIALVRSERFPSSESFWQNQLDVDPEKRIHRSYRLFWIWLSKTWFVNQAIQFNFFRSDFYMYSDIGCYRNARYNDKKIVHHMELVPPGATLWMAHHDIDPPPTLLWNKKLDRVERRHFYHSGSQGAGSVKAWIDYHRAFSETLDAFIERDMFVGEDQTVLQSACLIQPTLCAYVQRKQVGDNHYFGLRFVMHFGGEYDFWRPAIREHT
jgi:hypothetical protein